MIIKIDEIKSIRLQIDFILKWFVLKCIQVSSDLDNVTQSAFAQKFNFSECYLIQYTKKISTEGQCIYMNSEYIHGKNLFQDANACIYLNTRLFFVYKNQNTLKKFLIYRFYLFLQ